LGTPRPSCASGANILSGGVCQVVRAAAAGVIARQRTDLDERLRKLVNTPEIQGKIAEQLKGRLVAGPAGAIRIRSVSSNTAAVTVSFCLACAN
jgi:hypothetical protein